MTFRTIPVIADSGARINWQNYGRATNRYMVPITTLIKGQRASSYVDVPVWALWRDLRGEMVNHIERHVERGTVAVLMRVLNRIPVAYSESQMSENIATIRRVGISFCEKGAICFEGTQTFFNRFDIPPMECGELDRQEDNECGDDECERCHPSRTYTVTVSVTVTLEIESESGEDYVINDVENYLRLDVCGNVDGLGDTDVSIDDVCIDYN